MFPSTRNMVLVKCTENLRSQAADWENQDSLGERWQTLTFPGSILFATALELHTASAAKRSPINFSLCTQVVEQIEESPSPDILGSDKVL